MVFPDVQDYIKMQITLEVETFCPVCHCLETRASTTPRIPVNCPPPFQQRLT